MDREKLEEILIACANDEMSLAAAMDAIEELAEEAYEGK
jgi:hypothetical protein